MSVRPAPYPDLHFSLEKHKCIKLRCSVIACIFHVPLALTFYFSILGGDTQKKRSHGRWAFTWETFLCRYSVFRHPEVAPNWTFVAYLSKKK